MPEGSNVKKKADNIAIANALVELHLAACLQVQNSQSPLDRHVGCCLSDLKPQSLDVICACSDHTNAIFVEVAELGLVAHCVVLEAEIIQATVARQLVCENHRPGLHVRLDESFKGGS